MKVAKLNKKLYTVNIGTIQKEAFCINYASSNTIQILVKTSNEISNVFSIKFRKREEITIAHGYTKTLFQIN